MARRRYGERGNEVSAVAVGNTSRCLTVDQRRRLHSIVKLARKRGARDVEMGESAFSDINAALDRYVKDRLMWARAMSAPLPAAQVKMSKKIANAASKLAKSLEEADLETIKRMAISAVMRAGDLKGSAAKRGSLRKELRETAPIVLREMAVDATYASMRADLYRGRGAHKAHPALESLIVELGRIWLQTTRQQFRAGRGRMTANGGARPGAEKSFVSLILRECCEVDLTDGELNGLLTRAGRTVRQGPEVVELPEDAASNSDRFID